jgi:hypothetical protein
VSILWSLVAGELITLIRGRFPPTLPLGDALRGCRRSAAWWGNL